MPYADCLACKDDNRTPLKGAGAYLIIDPRIIMPGVPTIKGHGIGAAFLAARIYALGLEESMEAYNLSREELLVACWWAGIWGTRRFKLAWGQWAKRAGRHLWYGCIQIPDPPRKGETDVTNHVG